MRAGGLRKHSIEIQSSIDVVDRYGARVKTWKTIISTRSDVNFKSGVRAKEMLEMVSSYTVEFQIRRYHRVDESMRVIFEGRKYLIEAILPDFDNQMQTIITTLINE